MTPELCAWKQRLEEAIRVHAGHKGYSYCEESGQWYPHPPPAIVALDREFIRLDQENVTTV